MPMPPACMAGKSFNAVKPCSRAAISSVGVMIPGNSGKLTVCAAAASSGVSPGETPNCAPACAASVKSAGRVNVPTPTMASGTALRMASTAASATGVRMVTSSTFRPPAHNACASGTACSSLSMISTGITGAIFMMSRMFIVLMVLLCCCNVIRSRKNWHRLPHHWPHRESC